MAKLLRQRLPYNSSIYATGTWSDVAGTTTIPGHKSKTAADTTSTITVEFGLPAEPDSFGGRLLSIDIPMLIGTANLDAVITATLSRNNLWMAAPVPAQTFTAATDTQLITLATRALRVGQPVQVSTTTTLPGGLAASTTYWVGNVSGLTCQLFATRAAAFLGSSPIVLTSAGTGTHTVTCNAVTVDDVPITLAGTQVAFSANPRRLVATVNSPAFENVDTTGLIDVVTYTYAITLDAGTTTVVRVHDGFALWESTQQ